MDKPVNQQQGKFFANLGAFCLLLITILTQTPSVRSQAIFEDITIEPGFAPDPMQMKGISGGCTPAGPVVEQQNEQNLSDGCISTEDNITGVAETQTGPCVGFFDQQPDHVLELTTFFDYLSLKVQSPGDTTLAITGPGGTWCSDDSQDKNPVVAGQWLPGVYQVWVGSYEQNQYYPYIIQLSQVKR
ncbi:MAG: hypothetical protein F6K41_42920 [Symploca sp. SIO3E6]|nr:hypothetical protein [Caldora sp. SIO3E6]